MAKPRAVAMKGTGSVDRKMATKNQTMDAPTHLPSQPPPPTHRLLRGYAFDPSLATQLETALVSEITYKVPWEKLEPGPDRRVRRGGGLRSAQRCFYAPVDLDHPDILAQNGLAPVRGQSAVPPADGLCGRDDDHRPLRARARAQGVLGRSLRSDEEAVGRRGPVRAAAAHLSARAAHGQRLLQPEQGRAAVRLLSGHRGSDLRPVSRRHGLHLSLARHRGARDDARAAGRLSRALHGGDQPRRAGVPRGVRRHRRPVPALHVPGVLVAPDRQDPRRSWQREPAGPAGDAVRPRARHARRAARRDRQVRPRRRSGSSTCRIPTELDHTLQVHARGAILVAAVFDAFLSIYRSRTRDLLRLASGGTGVLPRASCTPTW